MGGVGEVMICLKSQRELETMDRANSLVHRVLRAVEAAAAPGVSTGELDELAGIRLDQDHLAALALHQQEVADQQDLAVAVAAALPPA